MENLADFYGPNAGYVLALYERYLEDPDALGPETRAFFERHPAMMEAVRAAEMPVEQAAAVEPALSKVVGVANLAQSVREYGHLAAQLDPLGSPPPGDPSLDPAAHSLSEDDLRQLPAHLVGGPIASQTETAWEAIQKLRNVYSSTVGYDYDHLRNPEERNWLRHAAESGQFRPPRRPVKPKMLLERLTQVEAFEHFLHRSFPGKTRFSIEGLDAMVPMLDEIVGDAVEAGIYAVLLGMAHRGRLNVLAHVLNRPYRQTLVEFKDPVRSQALATREELGWTGDVKYHEGARRIVANGGTVDLTITLAPNPSHLEHVNPVVEGMARAAGTYADQPGAPRFEHFISLPILIHGDAAFPGQGVVAETLNLSRLPGYQTGGTLHFIANNQLGFTTEPHEYRSTLYASDLAKGFKIPVVHVNADDLVACLEVARLAVAYRNRFHRDFLIDLVGYRRYGHNEGDEPRFTQPRMYALIDEHPTVRELWARRLRDEGVVTDEWPQTLFQGCMESLQETLDNLKMGGELLEPQWEPPPPGAARQVQTAVPAQVLRELHHALSQFPADFVLHARLRRILKRRESALDDLDDASVDWSLAEQLALASILADGLPVRLTGEDAVRGTFSQRHAVLYHAQTGEPFVPLQKLPQAQAAFEVCNSPLTENAAVGFEYGYNVQAPGRLVIWEAQYGDFINGAQVMIDEYLVSGRAKWGQTPSLVLLLPHGYEGQGPDHSTGRLERFLQLAAETNLRIANCTTAAQYFHLLRRQAALLTTDPLPLVVMTPKSLLRHALATSTPRELAEGHWRPVLDDVRVQERAGEVRRLILCSGKVFVDLATSDQREENSWTALVRVEQLYPFPVQDLEPVLAGYPNLEDVVWLQEEPRNMGAWEYVRPHLQDLVADRWSLHYVGRPRRASPAEGSTAWHRANQEAIVARAFAPSLADVEVVRNT